MSSSSSAPRIRLHDTASRRPVDLVPAVPGRVTLYVCGLTVDGTPHLGHARSAVVFDVLVRHLIRRGFEVFHVRNVTDVDDRILTRAKAEGVPWTDLVERNLAVARRTMDALGVRRPDREPRVTESIPAIVAMVDELVRGGSAYPAGGDVWFDVSTVPEYGRLSGRGEPARRGEGAPESDPGKRHPADFALWKAAKPGEPAWDSPWGPGRPGWHIECSAMIRATIGRSVDVHGGGLDLVFPHHENELAQSEAATGVPLARLWMHNGLLTVGAEKMAKSVGNVASAEEALARFPKEAIRAWLLAAAWRRPLDAGERGMVEGERGVVRLHEALARARAVAEAVPAGAEAAVAAAARAAGDAALEVEAALDDDLDTPRALAAIFSAAGAFARLPAPAREDGARPAAALSTPLAAALRALSDAAAPLGVLAPDPSAFLEARRRARLAARGVSEPEVVAALAERDAARRAGDFARADAAKARLVARGVVVRDGPDGSTWDVVSGSE